jgi:hypothetical protein
VVVDVDVGVDVVVDLDVKVNVNGILARLRLRPTRCIGASGGAAPQFTVHS